MDTPASHSPAGRANKRKRESPDSYEKPVGTPGSTKQVTNSSKQMLPGEIKTTSMGAACSLTSDLTQILQKKPALASSAIDLLDLYLCLWECYMIKSAGKIRLEEERRFLQGSNEWLVGENEKLQECCDNQELLLWDRRQAFDSIHQGILGTLQNNFDLDLDLESIWRESPNIPTSPPCLAANRSTLSSIQPISISQYAKNEAERPHAIECIFYPNHDSECAFRWTGPDLLSPDTCADDIFLYVSAFFLFERVHWIEIRLSKLSTGHEEVVEEYPFFLPRVESMLGNLRRARGQIRDIISRNGYMGSAGETRFQLSLRPQIETATGPGMRSAIPLSCIHPSMPVSSFDPQFFVQDIVGNWGI
ncbi:hypothetical protein N7517_008143 [Penicillium concentricum]|uniref:Uncharacterized protein n=1 Tax=Penicillium concentricum TaxID=293559 RepID=A0A9W9RRW3_9EURO|nr:uncharacterized protein N7517_008143 [Penicillium concentricum]KAJ5365257.1 hypothetical protein N7517_008143 [Penicillium concentricum]